MPKLDSSWNGNVLGQPKTDGSSSRSAPNSTRTFSNGRRRSGRSWACGGWLAQDGSGGGRRDEVGHGGREVDEQAGKDRLVEDPVGMQVLGRLRRQQVPLREGDRFDIPEDGVGGDHADGGDVAGDEVFGV